MQQQFYDIALYQILRTPLIMSCVYYEHHWSCCVFITNTTDHVVCLLRTTLIMSCVYYEHHWSCHVFIMNTTDQVVCLLRTPLIMPCVYYEHHWSCRVFILNHCDYLYKLKKYMSIAKVCILFNDREARFT